MTPPVSPPLSPRPAYNIEHPLRIGKSVRARRPTRRAARDFLALKFTHVPEGTDTAATGQLSRSSKNMTVELPSVTGDDAKVFTGLHRMHSESTVSDFVLVFVDGVFWLERVADYANCMRPGESRVGPAHPMDDHGTNADDPAGDPDSWMAADDDQSGSPITPEDAEDAEDTAATPPARDTAPAQRNGFGSKALAGMAGAGNAPSTMGTYNGRAETAAVAAAAAGHAAVGGKSVAVKTIAGKSVPKDDGAAARRRSEPSEVVEEEVVEEEVVEEDDDNASKSSSSDDDDSDDSDSDSDSDSADYTDGSTDED